VAKNHRGKLFEFAVLYHPQPKKEDGVEVRPPSQVIVPLDMVLARDDQEVLIKASREIPEDFLDKLDRVEIAVRPF